LTAVTADFGFRTSDWSGWPSDPEVLDPVALVRARAVERGSEIAVSLVGRDGRTLTVSWKELDDRTHAVAWRLRAVGARRALIMAVHGADFLGALLGCMGAGVAAIPVPPPSTRAASLRLRAVIQDAEPDAVLCAASTMELPAGVSRIDCTAGVVPGDFRCAFDPACIAIIQYTSGSTSSPRGVPIDGFNLSAQQRAVRDVFGHDAASRVLTWLPAYHDMGLIGGLLQPLYAGIGCVWLSPAAFLASPLAWLRAISQHRATTSGGPNFAYESCIAAARGAALGDMDLSSWRVAFNGSEIVRPDTIERFGARFAECGFQAKAFLPCYGLAEATLMATAPRADRRVILGYFEREALAANRVVPAVPGQEVALVACGVPVAGTAVAVIAEDGARVEAGRSGEIALCGPGVAREYLGGRDPHRFGLTLPGDGRRWLRTGDLGFIHEGCLYISGRVDDVLNIRGGKHHAADIEHTVRVAGGEAFAAVVAIGVKGEMSDQVVLLIERDAASPPPDMESVHAAVAAVGRNHGVAVAQVAAVPRRSLPRTTSGKIRRTRLRELYETGQLASAVPLPWTPSPDRLESDVPPGQAQMGNADPEASGAMIAAFSETFPEALIHPDSDFFALGGDSLRIHALCAAVERHAGVAPAPVDVLEAPTPLALARYLARRGTAVRRPGDFERGELSPAQRRIWFSEQIRPGFPFYHVGLSIDVNAALASDVQALLRRLVAAEPALRVVFSAVLGEPAQRVLDTFELPFRAEDVLSEDTFDTRVQQEVCRPFDLEQGVVRALLLRRPAGARATLLLTVHHIVCDGWGAWQLARQLRALASGAPLSAFGAEQYLDRCGKAAARARAAREAGVAFFAHALDALPEVSLPLDFDRPLQPALSGARRRARMDAATYARVADAGQRAGGTAFGCFLAALAALVRGFTQGGESLVGVVVSEPPAARPQPLACDLNFLPLRAMAGDGSSLSEWAALVWARFREALAHADTAFEDVVRALNPDRARRANPIYNVGLWFNDQHGNGVPAGMSVVESATSELDLRFIVAPDGDGSATIVLEYASELFLASTAQQLLEAFLHVVDTMVETPGCTLGEIDVTLGGRLGSRTRQRVAIAANFTMDPALDAVRFWCRRLELPAFVALAPYDQLERQLLQPDADDWNADVQLMVVDPDAWVDASGSLARIDGFLELLEARPHRRDVLLYVLPAPSGDGPRPQAARRAAARLLSAGAFTGVQVEDLSGLAQRYGLGEARSPYIDELGRHPFALPWLTAMGTQLFRGLRANVRCPRKVLVLDCDGTLWDGECASEISVPQHKRALQQSVLRLRASGVVLALCTRNRAQDVVNAFLHPDMCMTLDDIAAMEASWDPKSQSLHRLADALSLSVDSFVLIDDDPAICAEVRAHCPGVCVLALPQSAELQARVAEHLWELDRNVATDDDRRRAQGYRDEALRRRARSEAPDLDAFMAGLKVDVRMRDAGPDDAPRIAQLVQRSNQFNLSDCRVGVQEVLATLPCWRVAEVEDRFGAYGLTCVAKVQVRRACLDVDALVLSCRVLGRGVEARFFALLQAEAGARGLPMLRVACRRTLRNAPAFTFLHGLAPHFTAEEGWAAISADARLPRQVEAKAQTSPRPAAGWAGGGTAGVPVPLEERSDTAAILARIDAAAGPRPVRRGPYVAPDGPLEARLAEIFGEALRIERVGAADDFFELGGYSMLALRVVWRIHDVFGVSIPLSGFYDAPTVAGLADTVIDALVAMGRGGLERALDPEQRS
jgi:FkbH-like protein